jgi:cell division protein ZapA (FtsZ GTPase activity inhibitor)
MKQEERKQYEESRKIIYNAYMDLVVLEPDSANTQIAKLTEQFGGYVSEMGTYRTVIRVESQQLEAALEAIAGLGKVQSQSKQGADVTENYLDYQIRLDNALKARTRYLEQLQKAETVEAALKVEKELERLNETIDLLKGQMNRIDHLASFATITIQLKEKKKPGVLGYIGIGLYESVKWLFVRN